MGNRREDPKLDKEHLQNLQLRFINCNKLEILKMEEAIAYVGAGGIWDISVLSSQFCCESKTALKIIVNGFDDAFLNKTSKTWSMIEIIDTLNFSLITNFCSCKDKVNSIRQGGNICKTHI